MLQRCARVAFLLALCGAVARPALAQTPAEPPVQYASVMVVDVNALVDNSKAGKSALAQILAKQAEYKKEMDPKAESWRKEHDKLRTQQASMPRETFLPKAQASDQRHDELEQEYQLKSRTLDMALLQRRAKILEQIDSILRDLGKSRHANLVLQKSDLVLYDPRFDVTDAVLQKIDQVMPTVNIDFQEAEKQAYAALAPAKPGSAPATPASAVAVPASSNSRSNPKHP